jgi:hypothetical protein
LAKLIALLQPRKLPPQFNLIPFLTLLDPDEENKTMVSFVSPSSLFLQTHSLFLLVKGAGYIEHAKKKMSPGEFRNAERRWSCSQWGFVKLSDWNISNSFLFGSCISSHTTLILRPLKLNYWIWLRTFEFSFFQQCR